MSGPDDEPDDAPDDAPTPATVTRDWHRLAEQATRDAAARRERRGKGRPGQLSLGELPPPAAPIRPRRNATTSRDELPAPGAGLFPAAASPILDPSGSGAMGEGGPQAADHAGSAAPPENAASGADEQTVSGDAVTVRSLGCDATPSDTDSGKPTGGGAPRDEGAALPGDGDMSPGDVRNAPMELPPPAVPPERPPSGLPVWTGQWLSQRLARLRAGETIDLEAGEYRGTVEIRAPVTLRATGPVLLTSTTGPAVRVHGCAATLVGLRVDGAHGDGIRVEYAPSGRGAAEPRLTLDGCAVTAARVGVDVQTSRVRLTVRGGTVHGGDAGIVLPENGQATIAGSTIGSERGNGVSGAAGVRLALDGATLDGCGRAGVNLGARAGLFADEGAPSTLRDNRGSGIVLGRGSTCALAGASVTGNGGWGIVAPGGDVTLGGSAVSGNARGDVQTAS